MGRNEPETELFGGSLDESPHSRVERRRGKMEPPFERLRALAAGPGGGR